MVANTWNHSHNYPPETALAALTNLRQLTLSFVEVTDAGLKELAAMKGLRKLYLIRTKVTAGGLKELRKALPACEIRD